MIIVEEVAAADMKNVEAIATVRSTTSRTAAPVVTTIGVTMKVRPVAEASRRKRRGDADGVMSRARIEITNTTAEIESVKPPKVSQLERKAGRSYHQK